MATAKNKSTDIWCFFVAPLHYDITKKEKLGLDKLKFGVIINKKRFAVYTYEKRLRSKS